MTASSNSHFKSKVVKWVQSEPSIKSAVLFGSSARGDDTGYADRWSDVDLHISSTNVQGLECVDWQSALPSEQFCLQAVRPATGGVRKLTVVFKSGQIDLILVPISQLRLARFGLYLNLHKRSVRLRVALNEIHSCIRSGYSFLKGSEKWGSFYSDVMAEMPGVRLTNEEARNLANVSLCDALWVLQKLQRGELSTAQHVLHRTLGETNFRLLRELQLRRGDALPSFGLARRIESTLEPSELTWVQLDAKLCRDGLHTSTLVSVKGLKALMSKLDGSWRISSEIEDLLVAYF